MNWLNIKWIDCICNSCGKPFKSKVGNDIICKKCEKENKKQKESDFITND